MRKKIDTEGTDDLLERATCLLFNEERAAEAAKLLTELDARSLSPDQHAAALLLHGWIHERRAEFEQGRGCARSVLSESVDRRCHGKAHYLLGALVEAQSPDPLSLDDGAIPELLAEYRQAIDLLEGYPDQLEVIDAMAHTFLDIARADEAIALLESAASRNWPATELLGAVYARLGDAYILAKHDYDRARKWLENAIAILDLMATWHSWVHSRLAQCCNMQKDYIQAARYAKRALELAARDKGVEPVDLIRAHKEYAFAVMSGIADNQLAEKHWRRALALARGDVSMTAQLQAYLGDCLRRQDRWGDALRLFQQAFAADERVANLSWALKWAGCASARLQNYALAVDYLRRSLAAPDAEIEDPIRTYLYLGESLFGLKRYRDAAEALRTGLKLAPPTHEDLPHLRKWLLAANEYQSRQ